MGNEIMIKECCDYCENKRPTYKCNSCKLLFCEECKNEHHNLVKIK